MAEILNAGYQNLRDHIQGVNSAPAWGYVELGNASGAPIVRLPVTDARCTWTNAAGDQVLELTVVIKGSDSDIAGLLPVTFAQSSFFTAASGGSALDTESFSPTTLEVAEDQLTLKHRIQVPIVS
jgi:hypothetical protein